jgi:hypothetical protein
MTKTFITAVVLTLLASPALACNGGGNSVQGAPGPIAGAGLPILAVGYGVYWLVKRRRMS